MVGEGTPSPTAFSSIWGAPGRAGRNFLSKVAENLLTFIKNYGIIMTPREKEIMTMTIFVLTVLGFFFVIMWVRDFFVWVSSVGKSDYNFRLLDFCLTSALCVGLVWIAGRVA